MLSPATVHANDHDAVLAARHDVMLEIYATKPERFINGKPRPGHSACSARIPDFEDRSASVNSLVSFTA